MHTSNNVLQRRGKLEPLVDDPERELGSDPFSVVYISPCQVKVSNDPFVMDKTQFPVADLIPCNLTSYECPRSTPMETVEIQLYYDYEIHYTTGADINVTLAAMEGASLEHAAAFTGLLDCLYTEVAITRYGGGRSLQSLLTANETAALISISSKPEDQLDLKNTACIVPVQSDVLVGSTCVPINGRMTATIASSAPGSVEDGIRSGLLQTIRQGMRDDVYVSGNIKKVSFIGSRAQSDNVFAPGAIRVADGTEQRTRLSAIGISFISVGAILLCALLALFATRRYQRRTEEQNMVFHDATISARDLASEDEEEFYSTTDKIDDEMVWPEDRSSLAYGDELALQQGSPKQGIKTGDLDDEPNLAMGTDSMSDYMADTGTESLQMNSSLESNLSEPREIIDTLHCISESDDDPVKHVVDRSFADDSDNDSKYVV